MDSSFVRTISNAQRQMQGLDRATQQFNTRQSRMWDIAKGSFVGVAAANAVGGLVGKIQAMGSESIKLASDLTEVQNVVDVTFGQGAKQINAWSKTALSSFGMSELQAKQFSGSMGAMLKSSGIAGNEIGTMSTKLAGLAGDFASFYNLQNDEAWEKIRSGIVGETEPLQSLGINMSVANMEAYALSKGISKSWASMSQGEQVQMRYNYLMDKSKDAQGDFTRTQGSYANQQRLFNTSMQQASATIATKLLPHLTKLLRAGNLWMTNTDFARVANNAAKAFNAMANAAKWVKNNSDVLIPVLAGVTSAVVAMKVIGTVTIMMTAWKNATLGARGAQLALNLAMKASWPGLLITGIGLLVTAGVALWKNWDTVKAKAAQLWEKIKEVWTNIRNFLANPIQGTVNLVERVTGQKVGKNAAGTPYWRGGMTWVGERGPELANLPRGTEINSNRKSMDMLSAALGGNAKSSTVINFSPQISVQGGGAGVQSQVEQGLHTGMAEFKRMFREMQRQDRRLQFSPS